MFIRANNNPNAAFRVVPADSPDARISRDRRVITDRAGIRWNVGATVGTGARIGEPVAWRYDYEGN